MQVEGSLTETEIAQSSASETPRTEEPEVKHYGRKLNNNIFAKASRTVRDVFSATPSAILTRFWSGGHRNSASDREEAKAHQVVMNEPELKAAQKEASEMFKYTAFAYAYHGSNASLIDENAKYKLSDDERKYIGLEKTGDGKITYLNGSKVLGYLDDEKSGARAVALQDADGKITISIAGGDMSTGKKRDLVRDADDIFAITSGNLTDQFKQVYKFAKEIEQDHGHVDNFVGHSLGAQIATGLVPAFQKAKFYAFDGAGINSNLLHQVAKYTGLSREEALQVYDNKAQDVLGVANGKNSFNTLGWYPREITMVNPDDDHYKPSAKNVVPHGHFYGGGYYKAIRNLENEGAQVFNMQHDRFDVSAGPKNITIGVGALAVVETALSPIVTGAGALYGLIAHKKDNPTPLTVIDQLEVRLAYSVNGKDVETRKVTQEELDKILELADKKEARKQGVKLTVNNVKGEYDTITVEYKGGPTKIYGVEFANDAISSDDKNKGR